MHLHVSIFWFPSFLGIASQWNKKKIHCKQFKTPKTKFLGPFTDTTHANKCDFTFQRHSSVDYIFLINLFFTQTVLVFKLSCQNQVWHFKLLHTDCVQVKRYNVFFWSLVIMQSWLSWARGRMPAYWFRMKVGECIVRKINTLLYSWFFSCTTKGRGGQSNLWCAPEIWTCLFSYGKPVTKWMYSLLIEETPNLFLISHNYWFL